MASVEARLADLIRAAELEAWLEDPGAGDPAPVLISTERVREVLQRAYRPWVVEYEDMVYDGGGSASWRQGYHTYLGARLSAWLHRHVRSWGGRTTLVDNRGVRRA